MDRFINFLPVALPVAYLGGTVRCPPFGPTMKIFYRGLYMKRCVFGSFLANFRKNGRICGFYRTFKSIKCFSFRGSFAPWPRVLPLDPRYRLSLPRSPLGGGPSPLRYCGLEPPLNEHVTKRRHWGSPSDRRTTISELTATRRSYRRPKLARYIFPTVCLTSNS